MLIVILANGFIWARSSYGKFTLGNFVENLGGTLTKFASNNPYPWIKDFLQNTAATNSQLFGNLTLWGESLVTVAIVIPGLYFLVANKYNKLLRLLLVAGLLGGMFFNIVFYFAAGWVSPSTESLNLLMFMTQLIGLVAVARTIR